ncbi:MAG TPA: type II toxin-antitoxin system HipA family toxin [Solirubrobacteraceae bacterium]|jgi:serine/threonine-protein kinase HipA|nr:type II toxin-antitoxin system HipA family toxin [Solirubrobacteraceae bacterium]
MSARKLEVFCFGELAGTLVDEPNELSFSYEQTWIAGGMPPLSQSLPLDSDFSSETVRAFFAGLLPEGAPRELLARRLGISFANDFGLLEALAGDTAGALTLLAPGRTLPAGGDVEWLDDTQVAELIEELPSRPMHADEDGEYRLSLAGVQDKLPVVFGLDDRIGLTKGGTPSTHILKTPIARLDDTVINEAACLRIGRRLGVEVARVRPRRAAGHEFLLVERYDRKLSDTGLLRLHQEDFCQALGVPAQRKYESEGGPGLLDGFALLRRAAAVPVRETPRLLEYVALSFLVGNHDAHAKNYSLLYLPEGSQTTLAPAYDVLSTVAYRKTRDMSRKMAMKIAGEYRPGYVRARHLDTLLEEAELGKAPARRRLQEMAAQAPAAARETRSEFAAEGWDAPVLERIVGIVEERSRWLENIASSSTDRS